MEPVQHEVSPISAPDSKDKPQRSIKSFAFDLAETLILSMVLFLIINTISARIRIESISMQPTLYEGDFVIVNRLAYKLGTPDRGDVIVFRFPLNPDQEPYIKRIIGLPGDVVRVQNGKVYINGEALREVYIKAPPNYTGNWSVPQGQLFVLGDNRNNSSDSHEWGMVPIANVIGKAEIVYLPISHWQVLNPNTAAAAEP
jgi:signal peptidase I